jgi:hypothetical protein
MRQRLATIRRGTGSARRAFCNGLPPPPVKRPQDIIDRRDLDIEDSYVSWANGFIHFNDELVAYVTRCAPHESAHVLLRRWKRNEAVDDCFFRDIGHCRVWIWKRNQGWLVERNHPASSDPDGRILAHNLLDMPILCPTMTTAAQFAEACCPNPPPITMLLWHDYWH